MKPIDFPQVTHTLAKDQPQYQDLPIAKLPGDEGIAISQWQLSIKEKFKIVFTGKLWLKQLTFHRQYQPILPSTDIPEELR